MHNFTVAIINGSYMFQLHSSNQQAVYVRGIKPNHIPAVYIQLKMICGRYLSITYNGMWLLHINKHLQYKKHCIKLNNSVI